MNGTAKNNAKKNKWKWKQNSAWTFAHYSFSAHCIKAYYDVQRYQDVGTMRNGTKTYTYLTYNIVVFFILSSECVLENKKKWLYRKLHMEGNKNELF